MKKMIQRGLVAVGAASVSVGAFAQAATGPDMSGLTGAVNFGTVSTAVLSIAGLLAAVYVAIKGARIVLAMIRG